MMNNPIRRVRASSAPSLALLVVAAALAVGAWLRVMLALHDDGIYWPDEIYQSLEPAHKLVFGYGLMPWEYRVGARTWGFPGAVAGVLRVAATLGAADPRAYLDVIRLAFSLLSLGVALASYRLARALGAGASSAVLAVVILTLGAPMIYFAPRALSENLVALMIVGGLILALPVREDARAEFGAGLLLGLAVAIRLDSAVVAATVVLVLALRRRWTSGSLVALGLAASFVALGILDTLTWGDWGHTIRAYVAFQLSTSSLTWGKQPTFYYPMTLARSLWPLSLALPLVLLGSARSRSLAFIAAVFVVAHSAIQHKELRFMIPLVPLLAVLVALGVDSLSRWSRDVYVGALAIVVVCSLASALAMRTMTFADLGAYLDTKPTVSALDQYGEVNRLLITAGRQKDLCGVDISGVTLPWTGGYTYLHRRVPIYGPDKPPGDGRNFNYVIAPGRTDRTTVAADGAWRLRRVRDQCRPDPGYAFTLP